MTRSFDYVIIGAGSAGCVVAHRLSANPNCRVLLLEAGPKDRSAFLKMPAAFSHVIASGRYNWCYASEPEPFLNDRRIPCPRGRVLGGSSSINAMAFVRGHRADFDGWAESGLESWSYAQCLPYFKNLESFSGDGDDFRGTDGPLEVTAPRYTNPLCEMFLDACRQAGHPLNEDTNGCEQEGFGVMDQTIHDGRRVSTATAYLEPVLGRSNLEVRHRHLTTRVLFEDRRAVGVECIRSDRIETFRAEREVILCGGAINSPQLLMLSGVGEADELGALGIPVVVDLPGVGEDLQDHVDASVKQVCTRPVTVTPASRFPRNAGVLLRWLLFRTGPGATNHFETAGYIRTASDRRQPNIQIAFIPLLATYDGSALSEPHGFQATVMPLQPKSRGSVKLRSSDPCASPVLRFNYLAEEDDLRELREGLRALRRIFAQPAFDPYRGREIDPGEAVDSDASLDAFLRATTKSTHHPCSTCRMGTDDRAVVDENGRVRGLEGLRVVDSAILPRITSGNINAPTIMLAEKISDSILGKPPLKPIAVPVSSSGAQGAEIEPAGSAP